MRRSAFSSVTALVALLAASACTQDFEQFAPLPSPGSGGGGGGPTTATSGGAGGGEQCLNGDDDDRDGAVDCADDDCGGFTCVAVPDGWQGPGVLYAGPEAADVDCPAGFPMRVDVGGRDPVAEPATCSPCSCGAPSVECGAPAVTVYGDEACSGLNVTLPVPAGECVRFQGSFRPDSYLGEAPDVDRARCEASGGEATLPPPRFRTEALVCAPGTDTGGCAAGEACAPREIDAPFEPGVCIWREGERRCPSGFDERHEFTASVDDDRGCTRCTCDAGGVGCAATLTFFAEAGCRGATATAEFDGACTEDIPSAASLSLEVTATGTCRPRGGDPTGEIQEGDDTITVCCAR
ncbi:hypothetical protein [Sorangium sp. So ce854]|uniref:hypothetical protein n=1 Tax=Sorangium sp. So ce854 TaxID=3133322 RepID=UPI003F603A51